MTMKFIREIQSNFIRAQAGLHRDIRAICSEMCRFLDLEITKPAMEIIAELVLKKVAVYGSDLEAFARHAKRSTINTEDVKLLVRRNPSLKARLNTINSNSTSKEKRRKTIPSVLKPIETPAKEKEQMEKSTENDENVPELVDLTFE